MKYLISISLIVLLVIWTLLWCFYNRYQFIVLGDNFLKTDRLTGKTEHIYGQAYFNRYKFTVWGDNFLKTDRLTGKTEHIYGKTYLDWKWYMVEEKDVPKTK
jgi:hypothetical protein